MAITLSIFGIAFAAFCVWLGVRIYNRREQWAKWTAAGMAVMIVVGYPLSIGLANWLYRRLGQPAWLREAGPKLYWPIDWITDHGPEWLHDLVTAYVQWW